ncbi:MAG: mitochondrial inner membrane protein required for protein import [Alectoria sarmentosa]|nr:MAG: mitochondrial inner membrane protein required for protein import [Alectoria sarmentosa]
MLARVAGRSLRSCRTPAPPIQVPISYLKSRTYAKNNKPKRPFENRAPTTPNPTTSFNAPRSSESAVGVTGKQAGYPASQSSSQSEFPDTSKLLEEYDAIISSRSDNQPSIPQETFGPTSTNSAESYPHPDDSKLQDGFGTSAPVDGNTSPQSTSSYAIDPAEARSQQQPQETTRPLPDLTQGIPSTLDAEMESSAKADPASLNVTEDPSQPGGGSGGDLPKEAYISSIERRRNRYASWAVATMAGFLVTGGVYLGRNWESEEDEKKHPDAPSGWGFILFWNRVKARWRGSLDYYTEPAFPKLLPDTDPAWERPYTLVISLEEMLVHSEWTREHGWRMAKRPGVDYFLRYLSQYYELVIFTSVSSMIGHPVIQKLDPYRIVMWPLFREATKYQSGEYIKDLSFLNRDLSKIIMLDTVPAHAKLQPENAVILPKWKGDLQDKELVSYIPFLEFIATFDSRDTRQVLKSYEGTHIPSEFARREAKVREKLQKENEEARAKRPRRSVGFLGNVLGTKPQGGGMDGMEHSLSEGFEQGKTYQDQVRERGQKQYEIMEKEIRENGEKWIKEMAEEEKKMSEEAMKGMKSSITGVFPFGGRGFGSGSGEGKPS